MTTTLNTVGALKEVLGANWEGPYQVDKPISLGVYGLLHMDKTIIKNLWNTATLKKYYQ